VQRFDNPPDLDPLNALGLDAMRAGMRLLATQTDLDEKVVSPAGIEPATY
jgi:hypothetical protein